MHILALKRREKNEALDALGSASFTLHYHSLLHLFTDFYGMLVTEKADALNVMNPYLC